MSNWKELKDNPRLKQIYENRLKITRAIRDFFWSANFIEAETPMAVRFMSQEPHLNPIPIEYLNTNDESFRFFLRTSPEYSLKKLLASGFIKIFEIGKCFRNLESFGGIHNPEFTIIEWYRAPGKLEEIMDDVENLFKSLAKKLNKKTIKYRIHFIEIDGAWEKISMKELWEKKLGINLDDFLTPAKMAELCQKKGYSVGKDEAYENLFYKIFLNEIEPTLGLKTPTFIYDYPTLMTSLSTPCADPRYSKRFECYIGGLEICNAFGELTDANEQKNRLENDRLLREQLKKETCPVDPDFIKAIDNLPAVAKKETAGIALGLDRMVLLFTEAHDINEVIFQSVHDQIQI